MFCNDCTKATCTTCSIVNHPGHKVVELSTAGAGFRAQLLAGVKAIDFDRAAEATFKEALAAKIADVTGANASSKAAVDASRAMQHAAVDARCDALNASLDTLLTNQLATLRAQSKGVELHIDSVSHAINFATDVAAHGTDSEVGVTHVTALARLAGAKEEHAAVPWTPACEGASRLVMPSPEATSAWLAQQCKLVTAREVEEEAAAAEAAAAAARKKRADDDAAAAAAAIKKRADDAAAEEAAALRVRGACGRA